MPAEVIITVTVFTIIGCISFYVAWRKLQLSRQQGNVLHWYEQTTLYLGMTSWFLAVFFLLIGFHEARPQADINGRLLLATLAGIALVCGAVSCIFMIRYFPFTKPRE